MSRAVVGYGLVLWLGATLVLSRLRCLTRLSLAERLRPHVALSVNVAGPRARVAAQPGATLLALFDGLARRLARAAGIDDPVSRRLARIHAPLDPAGFRLRQLGSAVGALGVGALVIVGTDLPALWAFLVLMGAPAGACIVAEHRLTAASRRWQRRVERELPVVAEQLAMLVSAGYSTGSALHRIAGRGRGAIAADLELVCARVGQGLSEAEALSEWAALADVVAVHRLVRVLVRGSETSDLGRLLSAEARAIRRELQRQVVAEADRRTQTVWVPVTVAALVPGTVFLALPFLHALRAFAGP